MRDAVHKVAGMSGMHTVRCENDKWTCTCRGFIFHNKCKHVEEYKAMEIVREIDEKNRLLEEQ